MIKRFVIEVGFETEYPYATVEGKPGKTLYIAHPTWTKEAAERFATEKAAELGGKVVKVALESATWNIPALEPEAWKRIIARQARETAAMGFR